jgi:hypothetical protein
LEKLEAKLNVKLLLYGLEGRKKLSAKVSGLGKLEEMNLWCVFLFIHKL